MTPWTRYQVSGRPDWAGLIDKMLVGLDNTLKSLTNAVLNDVLMTVSFGAAATDVRVFHGLRAPVRTWEIVDKNADANVWRSSTENPNESLFIILQASAPVTVKLRFT